MSTTSRFVSIGTAMALALTIGGTALAALDGADQKCIDGYNNKLRLVSQQAGKSTRACVKNGDKGDVADPDACILADADGKIAAKQAKVVELYSLGKCTGSEVIQQGAATGNAAHEQAIVDLAHDVFGDPVTAITGDKDAAKCRDKAIQRATQAFTQKMKSFRKCKKDGMKAGNITDEATLESECLDPTIPDGDLKIQAKVQKLLDDVNANCAALSLATLFPGDCSGSGTTAALGACLDQKVECRVCLAINEADGTDMDCDTFDDGIANGSCGIGLHKCVLDTSPSSDSQIQLFIAALPVPLTFGMTGSVDIGSGGSAATCLVQSIDPINIPAIGNVCITPSLTACATGSRNCTGGPGAALGIDVQADGNTGACASEAACDASCIAFCAPNAVMSSGCTGFCNAGTNPACTSDAMCLPSDGACNGPDPVLPAQAGLCQCSCVNVAAGGASDPGDMQCNLGASLVVETAAPCDGTDVSIQVGDSCIPLSTQSANGLITDSNFTPGATVPGTGAVSQTGSPVACATVDASTTTGLVSVGHVNFFGSALGDLAVTLKTTCN